MSAELEILDEDQWNIEGLSEKANEKLEMVLAEWGKQFPLLDIGILYEALDFTFDKDTEKEVVSLSPKEEVSLEVEETLLRAVNLKRVEASVKGRKIVAEDILNKAILGFGDNIEAAILERESVGLDTRPLLKKIDRNPAERQKSNLYWNAVEADLSDVCFSKIEKWAKELEVELVDWRQVFTLEEEFDLPRVRAPQKEKITEQATPKEYRDLVAQHKSSRVLPSRIRRTFQTMKNIETKKREGVSVADLAKALGLGNVSEDIASVTARIENVVFLSTIQVNLTDYHKRILSGEQKAQHPLEIQLYNAYQEYVSSGFNGREVENAIVNTCKFLKIEVSDEIKKISLNMEKLVEQVSKSSQSEQ